ncbi:hypothetical protein HHK36_003406 [Tetracentron sinense]|uniref:Protein TIC 20 n=1 Tax=Tetracentron sinense TaxID=13715 RepID=A0A835DS53_TETSI|nr:hypothetical protein HHK36_003406 [Tetracentron sinense]
MAMATFLSFSVTPLSLSNKTHLSSSLLSLKHPSLLSLSNFTKKPRIPIRPRRHISAQSNGSNSADPPDRLISAICYFYPFFDGVQYVRFNTMQAIVLDVLLIFPDLLERSFNPRDGFGLDLMMSLDSTVFLFLLVSLIYGSSSCLLGQVPRLPIVAEAAERQVP